MYLNRFQQGDEVQYCGSKLGSDLAGKIGVVVGRVQNSLQGVVVEFGSDAYVMDELTHLVKFHGKKPSAHQDSEKPMSKADKQVAGPEVESRKGVSKRTK